MQSLRHRGVEAWHHFHFQNPFPPSPVHKWLGTPVLQLSHQQTSEMHDGARLAFTFSYSLLLCSLAQDGCSGHAVSDMFHDRRLRRYHLSQANRLESSIDRDAFQSPCLCPNRHAVDPAALLLGFFKALTGPNSRPEPQSPITYGKHRGCHSTTN